MAASTLNSVRNALLVLRELGASDGSLGVTELAKRMDLGKSTVHRLLTTLASEGFVQQEDNGRYALGITLWVLGSRMVSGLELREVAHPVLERLRDATGETVHFGVLDGSEVVYLDRVESQASVRLFRKVGIRMPAHTTSTGKCILAFCPPELVNAVIAKGLHQLGPGTLTSGTALKKALRQITDQGYVISLEESDAGVASIGAPVFDHMGKVLGAVSAAGPLQRFPEADVPRIVSQVREAADEISRDMGHRAVASAGGRPG